MVRLRVTRMQSYTCPNYWLDRAAQRQGDVALSGMFAQAGRAHEREIEKRAGWESDERLIDIEAALPPVDGSHRRNM